MASKAQSSGPDRRKLEAGTAVTFNRAVRWWLLIHCDDVAEHPFQTGMTARAWWGAESSGCSDSWAGRGWWVVGKHTPGARSHPGRPLWDTGGAKDTAAILERSLRLACGPTIVGWVLKQLHSLVVFWSWGAGRQRMPFSLCCYKDKGNAEMPLWSLLRRRNCWQVCHKADVCSCKEPLGEHLTKAVSRS